RTPVDVRARAHAAITAALKSDALKESLGVVGLIATSSTPEEMARSQQAEFERWGPLVKQIGFTGDS
ncbi:twin-arginine translocation pathway signal protein, partial [Comamonas sp. A7-5]